MTAPVPEMRRQIDWMDFDASTVTVSANDLAAVLDLAADAVEAMKCARYDCPDCKAVRARWRELTGEDD